MIVVVNKLLIRRGFQGIALWPFVILRDPKMREDAIMLHHEKIHLRQQIELFVVFFYIWYIIEFFVRWMQYKDKHKAYLNISFEREAYVNESNFKYLKRRSFWQFIKYLK